MNDQTDSQLLRAYVEHRSEPAFTELVRRHLDIVHTAALRMVCDSHLAQDVTQGVFVALARNAAQLKERPVLSGWLHRTAQNIAAQTVRTDVRRRVREQEAAAMNELFSAEPDVVWEHIAPHLDSALGELSEADRDALMLRYFERKSAGEMAVTLGISDEAAQKRVSRAVERLREFFARRGIAVGASGLVVVVSANAVQAAPIGLVVTISTAALLAGTTIATTSTATAIKTIAMTTLQKTVITATLAVVAGFGIYEARKASSFQDQLETIRQQQQPQTVELAGIQEREPQVAILNVGEDEQARMQAEHSELLRLRGEVGQLRRQAAEHNTSQNPSQPAITPFNRAPTTKAEMELAARQVSTVMFRVGTALRQFITNYPYGSLVDSNGNPNPDVFTSTPGLPLENLEIQVKDVQSLAKALDEKSRAIVAVTKTPIFFDGYYTRYYLLADGSVRSDFSYSSDRQNFTSVYPSDEELDAMRQRAQEDGKLPENILAIRKTLESVATAFLAANNGRGPTDLAELAPYATTQEQHAALQILLQLKQEQP